MMVAAPPGNKVPLACETSSQAEVLARVQFNEAAPRFVNRRFSFAVLNGPPELPLAVNPVPGVIRNGSGAVTCNAARAITMPEPEFRSTPGAMMSKAVLVRIVRT